MAGARVCLGVVTGAHGVRGLVKIKSFTEVPEDLTAYGDLTDESSLRRFSVTVTGKAKDALLARIAGVEDREAAQALRGTKLMVERAALPAIEEPETFYYADLVGLAVEDPAGRLLGRVKAVMNHGAGDLLEIEPAPEVGRATLLVPFTKAAVPRVDLEAGRLVVEPPSEVAPGVEPGPDERAR